MDIDQDTLIRFWGNIHVPQNYLEECWNWIGAATDPEFGYFVYITKDQKLVKQHASEFVYENYFGNISQDEEIYRTCNNLDCVNPNHLRLRKKQETNVENKKSKFNFFPHFITRLFR